MNPTPRQRGCLCTFTFKASTMGRNIFAGNDGVPLFELPLENELLKLKLKAEFGAECITGSEGIPPLIVNEFLKSVYAFEQKFSMSERRVTVYEKLGKPAFLKAEILNAKQIRRELKELTRVLHSQGMELDVLGDYEDRVIYKFLTEEFFDHQIDDVDMPGYIHHFCYEEFHPNHEMDIRSHSVDFLTQWFGQKINEYSWGMDDPMIHPDTRIFKRETVLKKISGLFESYTLFSNCEFEITAIQFDWDNDKKCGKGSSEGVVKYDASDVANEVVHFNGPFKLYFSNTCLWWSVFYFVFPGFSWE